MPTCSYYVWNRLRQDWEYLGSHLDARMTQLQARRLGRATATVHHTREKRMTIDV